VRLSQNWHYFAHKFEKNPLQYLTTCCFSQGKLRACMNCFQMILDAFIKRKFKQSFT